MTERYWGTACPIGQFIRAGLGQFSTSDNHCIGTTGPTAELEVFTASAGHLEFRIKTGGNIPITLGAYVDGNEGFLDMNFGGMTKIHLEADGDSYFNC